MFIKEDRDDIIQKINAKLPNAYLVPMYVRNYNDTYQLEEMDEITNFNPVGFHVGFGVKISMFEKKKFPAKLFETFECVTAFTQHSDEVNTDVKYYVFETGDPGLITHKVNDPIESEIFSQMSYYFIMLKDHLMKRYEELRQARLRELFEGYKIRDDSDTDDSLSDDDEYFS